VGLSTPLFSQNSNNIEYDHSSKSNEEQIIEDVSSSIISLIMPKCKKKTSKLNTINDLWNKTETDSTFLKLYNTYLLQKLKGSSLPDSLSLEKQNKTEYSDSLLVVPKTIPYRN